MAIESDSLELTWDKKHSVYRDNEGDPFCPKCFDGSSKRIHLIKDGLTFFCHTCTFRITQHPND